MLNVFRAAARRPGTFNPRGAPRIHGQLPPQKRRHLGGIPTVLLPPVVFGGLVITLWTWKCFMMVVFQNKIIYMPGLPPNARREKIEDYRSQTGDIKWKEEKTKAIDGTKISLCVASVENALIPSKTVYILYFQGSCPFIISMTWQVLIMMFRECFILASKASLSITNTTHALQSSRC